MDNTTLKFVLVGLIALGLLYWTSPAEAFVPFDESNTQRNERRESVEKKSGWCSSRRKNALHKASLMRPRPQSANINLLPKPCADDGFAQFAPDPKVLQGQNFVDASRWVELGAMTSKRNMSRDLRAEIPIPKNNAITPFLQSSIDQQVAHKPLDCA